MDRVFYENLNSCYVGMLINLLYYYDPSESLSFDYDLNNETLNHMVSIILPCERLVSSIFLTGTQPINAYHNYQLLY